MNKRIRTILLLVIIFAVLSCTAFVHRAAFAEDDSGRESKSFEKDLALAKQGNASAQITIGLSYEYGVGVPQNHKEAEKWYRKAAEQGSADGQLNLGTMYDSGLGVQQDYKEAAKWYRKAAEQGVALAQYGLGLMYGTGKGVPQDFLESYAWYNISAAQGEESAEKGRNIVAELLTPGALIKAEELSREYYKKYVEPFK